MTKRASSIFEKGFIAATALSVVTLALVPMHASCMRSRRAKDAPAIAEIATRLPSGDLALSGGARWLRFPSLEEPNAAFADGPAVPDPDPAGGMMAPPREFYSERANPGAHAVTVSGASSAGSAAGTSSAGGAGGASSAGGAGSSP